MENARWRTHIWFVAGYGFAWERALSKADIKRFGEATRPDGPILAVRVADLHDKEALLAARQRGFFTIPHVDGYAAALIELEIVDKTALPEAIIDGRLACAPRRLARQYLAR